MAVANSVPSAVHALVAAALVAVVVVVAAVDADVAVALAVDAVVRVVPDADAAAAKVAASAVATAVVTAPTEVVMVAADMEADAVPGVRCTVGGGHGRHGLRRVWAIGRGSRDHAAVPQDR